jgi:DNA-binding phage protein
MSTENIKAALETNWVERVMAEYPNMSPTEVAEMLGLPAVTFKKHLRETFKNPQLKTILPVAKASGLSLHYLLTGEGNKFWNVSSSPIVTIPPGNRKFSVTVPPIRINILIADFNDPEVKVLSIEQA